MDIRKLSSSSGETRVNTVRMPYRRRGYVLEGFDELNERVTKSGYGVKGFGSTGTEVSELRTIDAAYERVHGTGRQTKPVSQRTFEVGPRPDSLTGRESGFLRSGVVGCPDPTPVYRPKDGASAYLMKPGVGTAMRREDVRYGQNLASALGSRGLITSKRVLILGSGCAGSMANFFSREPAVALCIDSDPVKTAVLAGIAHELEMDGVVTVVTGDATDPGSYLSPGEAFDLILVTKAFGAIITSSGRDATSLIGEWVKYLSPDGVVAVDTQTFGTHVSPNGRLSGCFSEDDVPIATVWGRYDDVFYDLDGVVEDLGLTVREHLNLSVRGNCGKQGEALADSSAQMWVMYLLSVTPRVLAPVAPSTAASSLEPVEVTRRHVVLAGGCDLLPAYVTGAKLVPWRGIGDSVTREHIYPKFDGEPGLLYFSDGQVTFMGRSVTLAQSCAFYRDEYCFLAELCSASVEGSSDVSILVIIGVVSINGVTYDPNDVKTLQQQRSGFEARLRPFGIVVTSPDMLLALRGDRVRVPGVMEGREVNVDIPVDGLNVSVGGMYGNFIKPGPKCTLDMENTQGADLNEAVEIAMVDPGTYSVDWAEGGGTHEYSLVGTRFVPVRRRPDKRRGATSVRLAQDLAACIATRSVFARAETTWELYNGLTSRMSTYMGSRMERRAFFG